MSSAICQDGKQSEIIKNVAEELAAEESDPEAVILFIEQLNDLSENPVKINSGNETEISRLFFLTEFQIKAIADYINSSGMLVSFYELASIPGFDRQTAEMVIPFITLDYSVKTPDSYRKWKNTFLTNVILYPDEADSLYLGSPWKILTKYKFTAGFISGGITAEKDQGEKFLSGKPSLTDFFSAHLSYSGQKIIKRIVLGDYRACFGQGTNINTGVRILFSPAAPGYLSGRNEIKPYTSADENNFFRGAAAEFAFKNLGLSLFWSVNSIDATVSSAADSSGFAVSSFYRSGLHNTSTLMLKKDVVNEKTGGINITCDLSFLRIGLLWSGTRFSLPVKMQRQKPEDLFEFEGTTNNIYSFNYNTLLRKILLFGELSVSGSGNPAMVQGMTLKPSDRLSINLLYRNFTPGYHAFHGSGPGTGTYSLNHHGMTGNFTFEAAKHLFINAGCDICYFPWLKYRTSAPSTAIKKEIRLKYIPSENLIFDLSWYSRSSMLNITERQGIATLYEFTGKSIKGTVKYSPTENLTLCTAINFKVYSPSDSRGILMLQDLVYRFRAVPATIWIRYSMFNTDNWDSRLYAYENDLLYSFSIPALAGEGCRSYAMLNWELGDIAELRVKYGLTSYSGGNNDIPNRDELKIQLRVWF